MASTQMDSMGAVIHHCLQPASVSSEGDPIIKMTRGAAKFTPS